MLENLLHGHKKGNVQGLSCLKFDKKCKHRNLYILVLLVLIDKDMKHRKSVWF